MKYIINNAEVEAEQFTIDSKDRVRNWINQTFHNIYPDFEDGKPILKMENPDEVRIVRLADYVIKINDDLFYNVSPFVFANMFTEVDIIRTGKCKRKEELKYVYFDGNNSNEVLNFIEDNCYYFDSKIKIKTTSGYCYLKPNVYIIKLGIGMYAMASPNEFKEDYDV
jgi:hypothetical protein